VEKLLPTGLVGLVMAGLIAAVMSHISGAVNSCTTIATVDFYLPFIRKNATEAEAVRFGRYFGVGVLFLSVLCAQMLIRYSDNYPVFIYLFAAYGYFCPGIASMFLLGILWKRTTHVGALASGLLTIPMSAALQYYCGDMPFMNRTGIVFWWCMGLGIVVSFLTKPKPEAELAGLIWNLESLCMPTELRAKMRGLRRPGLWWAIVTAMVLYFFFRYP
jgi:solute:Na+ symporter, SSS family